MRTAEMPMIKRIILTSGQHLNTVRTVDKKIRGGNSSFGQNWVLNDAGKL